MSTVRVVGSTASVSQSTLAKYSHYKKWRVYMVSVSSPDGNGTMKATLQGWNGKRWVRAKAKKAGTV